ncbi:hypothetical protein C4577_04225 [Candidatus Parcubacteria bacterium]|nr:MAG: hypothetical protein C4577_04225 [Candidatus Parcubacteria bacterium]
MYSNDYDYNVYSYPEKSGLKLIDALDETGLSYEFNTLIALKHNESNRIYWSQDSGCSCPIPFENEYFKDPDNTSLLELRSYDSVEAFKRDVENFPVTRHEKDEFIRNVLNELRFN